MAKKKNVASLAEAIPVFEDEKVIVLQVNRFVTNREFDVIDKRLRAQEEKSGIKIVLIPYSVKLKEE